MRSWIASGALIAALVVGGCGGDDDGGGAAGGTPEAKVLDPALAREASGEVTYSTGKDTSGAQRASVRAFNEQFADQGLSAKLLEFPESADQQRAQFIQRRRARSGECDIFYSDVIWTAEFASQNWLYDLTPIVEQRKAEFIASTLETATYEGRYWGIPSRPTLGSSTTARTASTTCLKRGRRSTSWPSARTASSTRVRPTRA